jgi:hypothetical protein
MGPLAGMQGKVHRITERIFVAVSPEFFEKLDDYRFAKVCKNQSVAIRKRRCAGTSAAWQLFSFVKIFALLSCRFLRPTFSLACCGAVALRS